MSRASKSRWENEETGQYKKPVTKGKTCYVYKDKELIKEFSSIAAMAIWYLENYSEFGYVKVYRDIKKHLKEGAEYGGFTFTTNKPINI